MKRALGIILLLYCLNGCSDLRVIGAAAMREFHAEGVSVRKNKAETVQAVNVDNRAELKTIPADKSKSFSSFPHAHHDAKNPERGLWEKTDSRSWEN